MGYVVSAEAEADLEEIGDYIAQNSPARALTFIEEIRARFEVITRNPLACSARPEVDPDVRACIHGRYMIFYYVTDTGHRDCPGPARRERSRPPVSVLDRMSKEFTWLSRG